MPAASARNRSHDRVPNATVIPPSRVDADPVSEEASVSPRLLVVSLKICGLDKSVREMTLDLRMNALDAATYVGHQLKVKLVAEFGLAFPEKGGFLDEDLSLQAQNVQAGSELVYKKKFFVADEELLPTDVMDIVLMYPQCVDGLMRGSFKCSQSHAVGLAALQAVVLGEHKAGPSVSELAELLPPDMRNGAAVKCVMDQLEGMKQGLSPNEARFQLVHICSLLPGYGVSAYVVGDSSVRRSVAVSSMEKTPVLLGVSRAGISRMNSKTRECLELYPFYMLESFSVGRQTFVCDFGSNRTLGQWGVSTRSGKVISQLICGYQRLLHGRNKHE
jgi:hypothetical protein